MTYTVEDVDRVIGGESDEWENSWYDWKHNEHPDGLDTELGRVEYVEDHGGMDEGSDYWVVIKITDADDGVRFFQRLGYYASYVGGDLDGPTVEVHPTEKVVTVWEQCYGRAVVDYGSWGGSSLPWLLHYGLDYDKMSRWNGPAGRGAMRKVRADKRLEAEIRNEAYQEKIRRLLEHVDEILESGK